MASALTTSTIESLIYSYESTQRDTLVTPLQNKQTRYEKLNTSFSDISSKLSALKSSLYTLKQTGSDSVFAYKNSTSSNSEFVTSSAGSSAGTGAYSFRVDQLAKNDIAVSQYLTSSTANAITGTHTFQINTGDGEGGEFVSNIQVDFSGSETNQTMMEALRDAINSDKAVVTSDAKTGSSSYSGGSSEFTININGTEKTVTVNGGGTYSDLIDEIVSYVNTNIDGVTAEKVSDSPNPGDVKLQLTVDDSNDYISISASTGFDLVSDLNIGVTKEKAASGIVSASVFSPSSGNSQFSITAKKTGLDYRITSMQDTGTSTALSNLSLNLGSSRTSFDQGTNTAGFVYSDITSSGNLLNAKYTFNGLNLQSSLNDVSDLVSNTTFSFKSVMTSSDPDVTVNVGTDASSITSKIQDFITKFNDIYTYLKQNSTSTSDARGVLAGQSNASSLLDLLRNVAISPISGIADGKLKYLTQIGITFNSTSGLSVSDSSLLTKKINENLSQVENMFNNSTGGLALSLYNSIDPYLGAGGYLATSQSSFNNNITYIKDRISSVENRISKASDNLRNQYEQLQAQLQVLNNLQTQFFGSAL